MAASRPASPLRSIECGRAICAAPVCVMKAVMVAASKQQEENMTRIITQLELQNLSDVELLCVYHRVLNDLSSHDLSIE